MGAICKRCAQELPAEAFYESDSGRCKECVKARARENRSAKVEQYRAFDRARANDPARVAARLAYQASERGRTVVKAVKRAYVDRHQDRRSAHVALGNAIRDGKVSPKPCVVCGAAKADGHHFDYSRPLDVVWLCRPHHSAFHKIEREINRKKGSAA